MMRFLKLLKALVEHPTTRLLVGVALMMTGIMDIARDVLNGARQFRVGVHHGVLILGLAQALSALPDVVLGIEKWLLAVDARKAKDRKKD
jgi:hypothetical protein